MLHNATENLTDAENVRLNNDDTHLVYLKVAARKLLTKRMEH